MGFPRQKKSPEMQGRSDIHSNLLTLVHFTGKDWTRVTFYPDLSQFKLKTLSNDFLLLLERRAYDIAGTTDEKVSVYLNDELLPVKNFKVFL